MIFENPLWYWNQSLSIKFCDDVIKYAKSKRKKQGLTRSLQDNNPELNHVRNSNIIWLNENWIYREIQPYLLEANKNAKWNFDINYAEPCQFTIYNKNQFYDWHMDRFDKSKINNYKNINRKISMTICLSDRKDYEGGELEFYHQERPFHEPKIFTNNDFANKGSIVFFPSFAWHRVKEVTKGTRYSLVVWFSGENFK